MRTLTRVSAIALMLLSACAFLLHASADSLPTFSAEEDLIAYLQSQKSDTAVTVEVSCSGSLYARLRENDFLALYQLLYRSGIDGRSVRISYQDSQHFLRLKDMDYSDQPVMDAQTAADLEHAVRTAAETGAEDLILLCSPDFFETLTTDDTLINYCTAKYGIDSFLLYEVDSLFLIEVSSIRRVDGLFAYVEDNAQFASAVRHFADLSADEFHVAFSRPMYEKWMQNPAEQTIMIASTPLSSYLYSARTGIIHFSGAEYTDRVRSVCRQTEDLSGIFSEMGSAELSSFEIIFPYTETFDALYADDFALLHQIEAASGMTAGRLSYSLNHDMIAYEDAAILSDAVFLSSLEEAVSYTEQAVQSGEEDIHLFCTESLYNDLLGNLTSAFVMIPDGMTRIYDLLSHAGICDYDLSMSPQTHVIHIRVNKLFLGTAVILAEQKGDLSSLSGRERQAREKALEIAAAARSDDPLRTARAIHDWLCDHVVYTDDESTDEDDTAVGAILSGEANCDGYTDAFCLIGRLAGLNVRYQHGDSYEKAFTLSIRPVTHIWNLLELGGEWRMVDVTWDDAESTPSYIWFNVGQDVASVMHFWNEDMTVPLAAATERVYTSPGEFYADDSRQVDEIMTLVRKNQLTDFFIIAPQVSPEALKAQVTEALSGCSYRYSSNERMHLFRITDLSWR